MNLAEWLIRTARRLPQAPALMSGDRVVADYADFARGAASLAAAMRDRFGVAPGDRVAIFMSNRAEYLEILYGVWFCGAAVVPINCKLHAKEAAWIIENAAAKLVFASDETADDLAPLTGDMASVRRCFRLKVGITRRCGAPPQCRNRSCGLAMISLGSFTPPAQPASRRGS
jgi:acyl-CoA synthetase (AMP-forming)/AMP-acid ligase II